MKHKILLLLLLLIGSIAWAEYGFLSTIPIIHPLYGQLYDYEPKGVYPLPDGSMYVLGTAGWEDDLNGIPWSYGPVVTLLDPYGNLVWHRYPLWGSECQILFIDIDVENSIHYIVNFFGQYFVGMTDLLGVSTVGTGHMFNNQSLYLYRAKRLASNEILMAGRLTGKALLARLTASGDTISVARYARDPDSGYNPGEAIYDLEIDDEGYVLNLCKLSTLIHATILKTDIDGNVISRYDWVDSNYTSAGPQKYVGCDSNGGYEILISATSITSLTGPQIYLFDNDEISFLDNLDYLSGVNALCVLRVADNRYILARNSSTTYVCKTSTSGEILWIWGDSHFWNITTYKNDNVAIYGDKVIATGASSDHYYLYAVELLPNGQVVNKDDTQSPTLNAMSAYPNPMRDRITIKTQCETGANSTLYIYNIKGQRIRNLVLTRGVSEWDGKDYHGEDCPNGIYIIKSSSNDSVNYITKVK